MLRCFAVIGTVAVAVLVSMPAAQAQNFSFREGTIDFDKRAFKQEFDKMQRDLRGQAVPRSRTYCITCADGSKLGCKAVVGGAVGKGLCLLGGAASCNPPGVSGVANGSCAGAGSAT